MPKKKIVAMGGDGIGPEVIDAACYVLEKAGFGLDIAKPIHGQKALEQCKDAFPEETRRLCDQADAVLFGSVERVSQPILHYLRRICDNYVNLRPVKYLPGATSPLKKPEGIDFVIVREASEGLYPAREGDLSYLAERLPEFRDKVLNKSFADYGPGKFTIRVISAKGARRIADFACRYALLRKSKGYPGKVTCVTKSNQFRQSCGLFQKTAEEEAAKHPELIYEHYYIDNMAARIVKDPQGFDVMLTTNLFGDILSDEASQLVGGLGMASSAGLGGKVPYFEPIHGSAPKYAGKNVVNPTATILTAKLMLEHLKMYTEAEALDKAVAAVYAEGKHLTYDQGGQASTTECAEAILEKIK